MPKSYRKLQKNYRSGEIIFTENSICDGMYIINSGQVMVYKTVPTKAGPKEIELTRIGEKGMFGEMAVIDELKRSASVKAVEDTVVTIITKEMFDDQLGQLPAWVVTMIKLLVTRIRTTNEKLRKAVDSNAESMDVGGLFMVGDRNGQGKPDAMQDNPEIKMAEEILKDLNF